MATDRAAAPASERPLQGLSAYLRAEANVRDVFAPCPSFEVSIEQLRCWAAAVDVLADRAASAPQAVRMPLTEERAAVHQVLTAEGLYMGTAFVDTLINAVHGIVPLAPQKEGESQ